MDVELVARLRGVISKLARQLNATSTTEGLTPTQYSVRASDDRDQATQVSQVPEVPAPAPARASSG